MLSVISDKTTGHKKKKSKMADVIDYVNIRNISRFLLDREKQLYIL